MSDVLVERGVVMTLFIEGIALWAPALPGWEHARAAFRGEGALPEPVKRPSPQLLAPAERRRAPDTVALALEVATAAVAAAQRDAASLPCVFASAHGDLAINDYMCTTLVSTPLLISPTKFHNSVHNAAAGYWTIGSGCMQASSALSAHAHSFAAGLLEAATQCAADDTPVLLAAYDIAAVGHLRDVIDSDGLLAVALVIAPQRSERSIAAFDWSLQPGPAVAAPAASDAARLLAGNAMAEALPLFESLAVESRVALSMPLSARLSLRITLKDLDESD